MYMDGVMCAYHPINRQAIGVKLDGSDLLVGDIDSGGIEMLG